MVRTTIWESVLDTWVAFLLALQEPNPRTQIFNRLSFKLSRMPYEIATCLRRLITLFASGSNRRSASAEVCSHLNNHLSKPRQRRKRPKPPWAKRASIPCGVDVAKFLAIAQPLPVSPPPRTAMRWRKRSRTQLGHSIPGD